MRNIREKAAGFFKSIKFHVFIAIFSAMTLPVLLCNVIMINIADRKYLEQKTDKLTAQNTMLKNSIVSENYIDTRESALVQAEISRIANGYSGRVEIINADHIVISDTYQADEGKTCISEMVMRSMKGANSSSYNKERHYLEFATPVVITQNTDAVKSGDATDEEKTIGVLYVRYSTDDLTAYHAALMKFAVSVDVIVFVLAVALAFFIARRFSVPFLRIEKKLSAVTNGEKVSDLQIGGYTEISSMGESVNRLLDKLGRQEQARQEFVSNVSHELKTPITSMKVLADSLIGQKDLPEELYQEFLTDIDKEIDRENDIITDLLSLVKMEQKDESLNIAPVNLNEIVEQTLKRLRPIARAKNIELVFESFRPVIADADEVKIAIVISNLVENAIKYNVNDGWVRVSLNADHQYFYLKVSDSGIGIAKEDQDRIFERFFRVDKARSRETGGTGLGLAITRTIVVMHRGSIKVHSNEGEGTTFIVRIPLKFIEEN